ncbi:MAG: hypothetical protein H6918_10100 [Sphingomonadaceae bacterium]|nr:hypothetical protein [Sphingomonadaceae bacterium]
MKQIGFLACPGTLPGSPLRRADAYEHDMQVAALRPALAACEAELVVIDWHMPSSAFSGLDMVLVGTPWDYQDEADAFLTRLDELEVMGLPLCNPAAMVRWNLDKHYLAELAGLGAPTIPTLWLDTPDAENVAAAFDIFECDRVVVKRRVGAGAEGQESFTRAAPPPAGWQMDRPAMVQPFLPSIVEEGETSFIFVDGAFSHALLKTAATGDYRIQSLYGGQETPVEPDDEDIATALGIIAALPFPTPLYARIDMVRGPEGKLLLMEAELVEPYLYPEQGPELGPRMAEAIMARLG